MKKKEIRNLAEKLAKLEKIVQSSDDKDEISKAEMEMFKVSSSVKSLEDMMAIDEMVLEILEKN